jgi:hypothetical protein
VMFEAVQWGERDARINTISPGIIMTPLAKDELTGPRSAQLPAHDRGLPGCNRSIFKLVSFSRNVVLRGPFNSHLIWFQNRAEFCPKDVLWEG